MTTIYKDAGRPVHERVADLLARMTPEDIRISTQTALAELALSGCTTASDHLYLFPNGSKLDDEIEAAAEVGIRLHASRGSMSLGQTPRNCTPIFSSGAASAIACAATAQPLRSTRTRSLPALLALASIPATYYIALCT